MDKLRALQYFLAAAESGSLSAAARELGVSLAAVAKLVSALERDLGSALFDRTPRGLALTSDGEVYLEACRPAVEQIAAAGDAVRFTKDRPRGTVVVGAPNHVARHCLVPALEKFHARFPEIDVDLRNVGRTGEPAAKGVEVFILMGWLPPHELVAKRLAMTRGLICATPSYWRDHGTPKRPADLLRHTCFPFRNPDGVLLDHWRFSRGDEVETVTVKSWLTASDRETLLDATLAGAGVMRLSDVTVLDLLASGRLVAALNDWEMLDNPPITLLYRTNHRRTPRLRAFVDFATALFADLVIAADPGPGRSRRSDAPRWSKRSAVRASTMFEPKS